MSRVFINHRWEIMLFHTDTGDAYVFATCRNAIRQISFILSDTCLGLPPQDTDAAAELTEVRRMQARQKCCVWWSLQSAARSDAVRIRLVR